MRRGDHVQATEGHIGRVQGLLIDRRSGHVTHVLLHPGASAGGGRGSG